MTKINITLCAAASALLMLLSATGCYSDSGGNSKGGSESGQGGSMARFTIKGDYLYTVDDYKLNVVSLSTPGKPFKRGDMTIDGRAAIETIFTMDDMLFIGSQNGMYIFSIKNPEKPELLSTTLHFKSCDPVVAFGNYAYVTLNSTIGSWCGNIGNVLQTYDISDPKYPVWKNEIAMSSPRGLAVAGADDLLFVCDGGIVEAYDLSDPAAPEYLYSTVDIDNVRGMDAYDCIAMDGTLLVIGDDGLCQLGYDRERFSFVSKIDLR